MSEWAKKRQKIILGIFLAVLIFIFVIPGYFLLHKAPTCSDGRMNGDETGIDCGGGCRLLCTSESLPIVARGDARVLSIASTTYEVVTVFENPNANASIKRASYVVKIWDDQGAVPLKQIEGETLVPRNSVFAVFLGPFNLDPLSKPMRATFEWKEPLVYEKDSKELPSIVVKSKTLTATTTSPRLNAEIQNISLMRAENIELVAILTDESGNIFAANRTIIDSLDASQVRPVVFTWPKPFAKNVLDIRIIPRIFPDPSYIR